MSGKTILGFVLIGSLCGVAGWQLGSRRAGTPPAVPMVGTTQATIESIWGKPVGSSSFTVKLNGEPVTIVTSTYAQKGTRIKIEYDQKLMAKKVEILD